MEAGENLAWLCLMVTKYVSLNLANYDLISHYKMMQHKSSKNGNLSFGFCTDQTRRYGMFIYDAL